MIDFIGHTYAGYYTGQMPEANVEIGLPFAWETADEMWDGLHRWGLDAEFKKIYAENNAYPITWPMGNLYGIGTNFEIDTPDKIKGKRIRALGIYGDLIRALGGSPVTLPMPELYQALMLGTIDGGIHGAGTLEESKMAEPEKYFVTYPNLNTIGVTMLINLKKFNALPEDIKNIIREDAPYIMRGWASDYSNFIRRVIKPLIAKGMIKEVKWSEADAARIRQLGISLWDKVAKKTPRTAKLVEMVKAHARAMGKIP
jgi:TRAP-type C4-dicarboxylate transport system substrate-binding protein